MPVTSSTGYMSTAGATLTKHAADGVIGANLTERDTVALFAVPFSIRANKGKRWVYGKASEAISVGACSYNPATGAITQTTGAGGFVATAAFSANEYGFIEATGNDLAPSDDSMVPTITLAAGSANNKMKVSVQMTDGAGTSIAGVFSCELYLSDAATGIGITASGASGTLAALSTKGAVIATSVANKAWEVVTNASGLFEGEITDTSETATWYVVAKENASGRIVVSAITAAANWG